VTLSRGSYKYIKRDIIDIVSKEHPENRVFFGEGGRNGLKRLAVGQFS
jgi:hypothetical protein